MRRYEINEETIHAYLETLVWSETLSACDDSGEPSSITIDGEEYADGTPLDQIPGCDASAMPEEVRDEVREDLEGFQTYCLETLGVDPFTLFDSSQVAHDFCLSRNGHGAGFFDDTYKVAARGPGARMPGPLDENISDDLQRTANTFGTHGLFVWVDAEGNLKVESHG